MSSSVKVVVISDHFKEAAKAASGPQLLQAVTAGGMVVKNRAQLNIRSQGLIDTSYLVNSISVEKETSSETSASVAIGTNVIYAAIHEFGGTIVPKTKKMLSWLSESGERIFAKAVHIPARPYLRPALDESEDDIQLAIGNNLAASISRAVK